jgi:probable HAF family extracellular repeat protein
MNINRTSGKRVGANQRNVVTAQNNQATIRKPWKSLVAVAFGLLLSVPGLTQAQYSFTTIDVPNSTATAVNGNSPNAIAGQFDDSDGNTHGFVLNNGSFATIDVPGAGLTIINGINAPGQLVGTYVAGGMVHSFFDNNGSFITLDPPGAARTQGGSINAKGQVVGTYRDRTQARHGFFWRNGTFTTFNVPGNDPVLGTVAMGINDVGAVVGNYVDAKDGKRKGFLRTSNGSFATIDVPGAAITIGEGINNPGTIVGVYVTNGNNLHGFVLNNGAFMTVDVPDQSGNAQQTEINSINAKGEIVGYYLDSSGVQHGFLGVPAR